jgi:hypothetical protein
MTETEKLGAVIVAAIRPALQSRDEKIKALESRIAALEGVSAKALRDRLAEKVKAMDRASSLPCGNNHQTPALPFS